MPAESNDRGGSTVIFIRTDTNRTIATGHLMRCIAIAEGARLLGEEPLFFLSDETGAGLLKDRGLSFEILGTEWDHMEEELPVLLPLLKKHDVKKLLVDSYSITLEYLQKLGKETEVWYLDDLNAFHYPVQGLICYANYHEKYDYPGNYPGTELLLGTSYVPLRPEFRDLPIHTMSEGIRKLLMLSGGADPENVLERLLTGLELSPYERVDVVCGRYYQKYEMLKESYASFQNIFIHQTVPTLLSMMKEADLAISAGGTTLYELCAAGTPTISYSMADNQLDNVKQFEKDGLMYYAGDARKEGFVSGVQEGLIHYGSLSPEKRTEISRGLQGTVDGQGAERIARHLIV